MTLGQRKPVGALERLASRLFVVDVLAGVTVIEQGDPGDRLYVIGSGEAEVLIDGRHIRVQGPGDVFGEIALVRDVPRTATVRARTDLRLHALERDVFLDALGGRPTSRRVVDDLVDERLAVR
jgi:CRP-like cAMP-binding protein